MPSPARSFLVARKRAAHGLWQQRRRRGARQALSCQTLPSLPPLALSFSMSLCLPPSHSLGYPLGDLLFLRSANLVQVDALGHQLLQHLAHEIFVDVFCVEVGGAQQRAQAGLVLDSAGRYDGPGRGCAGRILAGRPPLIARPAGFAAPVAASLPCCALSRRLPAGPPAACDARVPQTRLLSCLEHALMGVIALIPAPELG